MRFQPGYLALILAIKTDSSNGTTGVVAQSSIKEHVPCTVPCVMGVYCPCTTVMASVMQPQPMMMTAAAPMMMVAQAPAQPQMMFMAGGVQSTSQSSDRAAPCVEKETLDQMLQILMKIDSHLTSETSHSTDEIKANLDELGVVAATQGDVPPASHVVDLVERIQTDLPRLIASEREKTAKEFKRMMSLIQNELKKAPLPVEKVEPQEIVAEFDAFDTMIKQFTGDETTWSSLVNFLAELTTSSKYASNNWTENLAGRKTDLIKRIEDLIAKHKPDEELSTLFAVARMIEKHNLNKEELGRFKNVLMNEERFKNEVLDENMNRLKNSLIEKIDELLNSAPPAFSNPAQGSGTIMDKVLVEDIHPTAHPESILRSAAERAKSLTKLAETEQLMSDVSQVSVGNDEELIELKNAATDAILTRQTDLKMIADNEVVLILNGLKSAQKVEDFDSLLSRLNGVDRGGVNGVVINEAQATIDTAKATFLSNQVPAAVATVAGPAELSTSITDKVQIEAVAAELVGETMRDKLQNAIDRAGSIEKLAQVDALIDGVVRISIDDTDSELKNLKTKAETALRNREKQLNDEEQPKIERIETKFETAKKLDEFENLLNQLRAVDRGQINQDRINGIAKKIQSKISDSKVALKVQKKFRDNKLRKESKESLRSWKGMMARLDDRSSEISESRYTTLKYEQLVEVDKILQNSDVPPSVLKKATNLKNQILERITKLETDANSQIRSILESATTMVQVDEASRVLQEHFGMQGHEELSQLINKKRREILAAVNIQSLEEIERGIPLMSLNDVDKAIERLNSMEQEAKGLEIWAKVMMELETAHGEFIRSFEASTTSPDTDTKFATQDQQLTDISKEISSINTLEQFNEARNNLRFMNRDLHADLAARWTEIMRELIAAEKKFNH